MTDTEIYNLNLFLVEKVLGLKRQSIEELSPGGFLTNGHDILIAEEGRKSCKFFDAVHKPVDAFDLLKKCAEKTRLEIVTGGYPWPWRIHTIRRIDGPYVIEKANTLELAIALFARKLYSK